MRIQRDALLLAASLAVGCGGGSPTGPGPTPTPGVPVSGYVFYDENGNGVADAAEVVRLPGVTVSIGGSTAVTGAGGRFTVASAPSGAQSATTLPTSLPAYFASVTQTVTVPAAADVAVPVVLPLGTRARANIYLAFGDSITFGDGSTDRGGYRGYLQADLRSYWGKAILENGGVEATKTDDGRDRLGQALAGFRPGYVLILYGTNDYNLPACRQAPPCSTVDNLRSMVRQARAFGAEAILGTIPPVNPAWADRNPDGRNAWVKQMDNAIVAMAQQEQVAVADVFSDFKSQPDLSSLFDDDKHPNDAGYRVMARSFFNAITKPYPGGSASSRTILFSLP